MSREDEMEEQQKDAIQFVEKLLARAKAGEIYLQVVFYYSHKDTSHSITFGDFK